MTDDFAGGFDLDPDSGRRLPLGNQHLEDLRRWRDDYVGRRTVPYQMLDEAMQLSRRAVAEERRVHELAVRYTEEDRDRRVAEAEARVEHYKALWESSQQLVARYQQAKPTDLKVLGLDDKVHVIVHKPLGGWTLGMLEDAAWRFRTAGGEDHLPVEVNGYDFTAVMDDAGLALVSSRPLPLEPRLPDPGRRDEYVGGRPPTFASGVVAMRWPLTVIVLGFVAAMILVFAV